MDVEMDLGYGIVAPRAPRISTLPRVTATAPHWHSPGGPRTEFAMLAFDSFDGHLPTLDSLRTWAWLGYGMGLVESTSIDGGESQWKEGGVFEVLWGLVPLTVCIMEDHDKPSPLIQ